MAYRIMDKNKINKESKTVETARDKGVTSSDWLYFIANRLGSTLIYFLFISFF